MQADMVVIGSGAAGMTAATVAAKKGLSVILLEATEYFGGTTAFSGGGVWIPANHYQPSLGFADSVEEARTYLKAVLGNFYNADKVETYLSTANEMLAYMEANTTVRLMASDITDYAPDKPGWKRGRCLLTADFDGSELGDEFEHVRPPIPEMGMFNSMQVSPADAVTMQGWNTSIGAFRTTTARMLSYGLDRIRRRRGRHMANGNALAGRLYKSARDAGAQMLNNARARDLILENGRVTGVEFERDGKTESVSARFGVVLASGGFGQNEEMRQKWLKQSAAGYSLQPEGSRGDGIRMGKAAGGRLNPDNAANGIWVPASRYTRPDGTVGKFPSLFFDRHCPGHIMVDARSGERFVDESFHYQNFGEVCLEKGVTKIWQIADAEAVAKYGLGAIKPAPFKPDAWVRSGYAKKAETIAELAGKIGLDPAVLTSNVERFNTNAAMGEDPDFGRGSNDYDLSMGDPSHGPNPNLRPLTIAPFYAIEVRPSDLGSVQGLDTNERAEVLGEGGAPIPGLYAAGLDNNSMMRGKYPGGGSSLGPAMTFGYIAANRIAATKSAAKEKAHV